MDDKGKNLKCNKIEFILFMQEKINIALTFISRLVTIDKKCGLGGGKLFFGHEHDRISLETTALQ